MSGYVLITIIFSASVLLFCWILLSYLYHAIGGLSEKELHKLRFKNKFAFALTSFWKAISEAKFLPQESIKKEVGRIETPEIKKEHEPVSIQEFRESKVQETVQNRKRYRIKEKM